MHNEVIVLLLSDPLERDPPRASLPFLAAAGGAESGDHRVELDLATAGQRQRWRNTFMQPVDAALARLPARGVRVQVLSTDAPSESWLPLLGRSRAA